MENTLESKKAEIFTLFGTGKKVAFTNANRKIDKSVVKTKKESIKNKGLLLPIVVVDAKELAGKKFELYDADTSEKLSEDKLESYLVIVDGQHRYKAIKELEKEKVLCDIWLMYPLNKKLAIANLIMEINSTAVNWKNGNYADVLYKLKPDNEALKFLHDYSNMKHKRPKKGESDDGLPNNGYGLSVLSKYLTFSKKINKSCLYKFVQAPDSELPNCNVKRAKYIIDYFIYKGFTHRYLTHRFFIDKIIELWNSGNYKHYSDILEYMDKTLTKENVTKMLSSPNEETFNEVFKNFVGR